MEWYAETWREVPGKGKTKRTWGKKRNAQAIVTEVTVTAGGALENWRSALALKFSSERSYVRNPGEESYMRRPISAEGWKRRTIEMAVSVLRLMQIMKAAGDVELRQPAQECPGCKKETEVWVVPEGLCGDCWARNAIVKWKVRPASCLRETGNGTNSRKSERRKMDLAAD